MCIAVIGYALFRALMMSVMDGWFTYLPLVLWLAFHLYIFLCGLFFVLASANYKGTLPGEQIHDLNRHPFARLVLPRLILTALSGR